MSIIVFVEGDRVAETSEKLKSAFPGADFSVHRVGSTDEISLSRITASCPACNSTVQVPVSLSSLRAVTTAT